MKVVGIGLSDILSQWKWLHFGLSDILYHWKCLGFVLLIYYPNESGWHWFKWYIIPMKVVCIDLSDMLSQWKWLALV